MKNILVAIEFSDVTNRVLEKASDIALAFNAKIWLLHCVHQHFSAASFTEAPLVLPLPEAALPERFPSIYLQLCELSRTVKCRGVDVELLFVSGAITHEILKAVEDYQIDLIVIGSRGHGSLYDLVVGTVTKSVLYYSSTPTMIIPCEHLQEESVPATTLWDEPLATPYRMKLQ